MMFHCASVTPLSIAIHGRWSSTASGTRHARRPGGTDHGAEQHGDDHDADGHGIPAERRTLRAALPSTVDAVLLDDHPPRQPVGYAAATRATASPACSM